MKMLGVKKITGKIIVRTGLHIGGDTKTMEIGGMDNPIIRNPATGEPYIPGSSLKGKMRALYEMGTGRYSGNGNCCNCGKPDCPSCVVFGSANNGGKGGRDQDISTQKGPTRLIVRDAFLNEEYRARYFNGDVIVEEKSENSINRITADANLRQIERILPGVTFDFEFIFRMYSSEDEKLFSSIVLNAMKLLEDDYLGGGGSRGSGKIEFVDVMCNGVACDGFNKSEH